MNATNAQVRWPAAALVIGVCFISWTFLWDNARQSFGEVADPTLVIPLPRATKFVEALALVAICCWVVAARGSRAMTWVAGSAWLMMGAIVAACSAVIGVIAGYTSAGTALQVGYAYLAPLIFAVALGGASHYAEPRSVLRVFIALTAANGIVALYQFIVRGEWGDTVHGAMHDAHVYANAGWLAVLWCLVRLYNTREKWWWPALLAALLAPTAWAAQNEAGNLVMASVVGGAVFVLTWRRGWRWRLPAVAVICGAVTLFVAVARGSASLPRNFVRLEFVLRNLPALGVVEGYTQIPSVMASVPYSVLVGTGPGSYGSAQAVTGIASGERLPLLAERYTGESYRLNATTQGLLGSFVEQSTDATAFVVEFGPVAALCGISALWFLIISPAVNGARASSMARRIAGQWVILAACYILLYSGATAFYGWSVAHTSAFAVAGTGGLLSSSE